MAHLILHTQGSSCCNPMKIDILMFNVLDRASPLKCEALQNDRSGLFYLPFKASILPEIRTNTRSIMDSNSFYLYATLMRNVNSL